MKPILSLAEIGQASNLFEEEQANIAFHGRLNDRQDSWTRTCKVASTVTRCGVVSFLSPSILIVNDWLFSFFRIEFDCHYSITHFTRANHHGFDLQRLTAEVEACQWITPLNIITLDPLKVAHYRVHLRCAPSGHHAVLLLMGCTTCVEYDEPWH